MTAVLLIADSERVQSVFADLESRGVLQLHAAATLDHFDQELAAVIPAFTFIQSRISGLSTGILLRHVKKALPESSKIILLSGDDAELQPGSASAIPLVDLRAADELLAETIAGIVTDTAPPPLVEGGKGGARQVNGAKKRPPQEKRASGKPSKGEQADALESAKTQVTAKKPQEVEQAKQWQAADLAPLSQGEKQAAPSQAAGKRVRKAKASAVPSGTEAATVVRREPHLPERSQPLEGEPAAVEPPGRAQPTPNHAAVAPPEQAEPEGTTPAAEPPPEKSAPAGEELRHLSQVAEESPVQEAALSSAGEGLTAAPHVEASPAGEPAVTEPAASPTFMEMMAAASARRDPGTSYPPDVQDRVRIGGATERAYLTAPASDPAQKTEPWEPPDTSPAERLLQGTNPGEDAALRRGKMNKPLWLFLLLFAFLMIPAAAYLAGRVMSGQEQEGGVQGDGVAGQRPALTAAAASATALTASRATAETTPKGALPPEAADVPGLAALPPFLEGVERDRGYGDRHPGWERYVGANAEYRLFREDGRYRAIQAIARGDEIPDQLFRKVLLEFGGIAGYVVKSTGQKGEYLVEQAAGSGSASLTIYRKRNDPRIKGLVVYYR